MNDITAIELINEALIKAEKHEVFNKMESVSVNSALIHLHEKITKEQEAQKEIKDDKSDGKQENKHRKS